MKKNIGILLLLLISNICNAQWSQEDLNPYQEIAAQEVQNYINEMIEKNNWNREDDAVKIEFTTDTMQIESVARSLFADKFTMLELRQTISYQMDEYDRLLNKYYRKLMDKLTEEDQVTMREAQRTWLKYRDSEFRINKEMLAPNSYMGGGSLWPVVALQRSLEIVKERVASLYDLYIYISDF